MPRSRSRPRRDVSGGRKAAYYLGMILIATGFISFFSVFVTGAMNFGDFSSFDSNSEPMRAVIGMGLMIGGIALSSIGSRGLAGSGVVLDPQQARRDVEPWSRMGGGILKDTLDEAGVDLSKLGGMSRDTVEDFEAKLRKLHQLHADGILSDEEYAREKREVLDRI